MAQEVYIKYKYVPSKPSIDKIHFQNWHLIFHEGLVPHIHEGLVGRITESSCQGLLFLKFCSSSNFLASSSITSARFRDAQNNENDS